SAILYPLAAAVLHSLYQLSTRFLSRTDGTLTTLIYSASTGAVLLSLVVPVFWVAPGPLEMVLMVVIGIFAIIGHFCLIKAFEAAPPAIVSPFHYTNLIWSTLFGYILFADLPDMWTVTGALIIAGSGLYIFHRERTHGLVDGI
ncbi:MAG TPA: DMT family transporter, partial [Rhodospirillales bacterium]|nr:DMT family transporter [Rhodospirillales bacterium]